MKTIITYVFVTLIFAPLLAQTSDELFAIQKSKLYTGHVTVEMFEAGKVFEDEENNVWGYKSNSPDQSAICWLDQDLSTEDEVTKEAIRNLMSYNYGMKYSCKCKYAKVGSSIVLVAKTYKYGFISIANGQSVLQSKIIPIEGYEIIDILSNNPHYLEKLSLFTIDLFSIGINGFTTKKDNVFKSHSYTPSKFALFKSFNEVKSEFNELKEIILLNRLDMKLYEKLIIYSVFKDKWLDYSYKNPSLFLINNYNGSH